MANLLEKASIILTPTAYDDGKVLAIKPSEAPYGDFDFTRNSSATRVNAQGLVEDVQILSSNLVQNGDFSEIGSEEVTNGNFSQESSELVTNGDFATDSDWVKTGSIEITNGQAIATNASTEYLYQSTSLVVGKFYKITFTVSDYISGIVRSGLNDGLNNSGANRTANGTYTDYIKFTGGNTYIGVLFTNNASMSIDNVSVKEVGQDWTLGTGWSIGEDKAISDGTDGDIIQTVSGLSTNTYYKVVFDVSDYVSGTLSFRFVGGSGVGVTSNGTKTIYLSSILDSRIAFYSNAFIGSVTNISVKEVGQNWVLDSNWSIGNGVAISDGSLNGFIRTSTNLFENGKTYKVGITVSNMTTGKVTYPYDGAGGNFITTNGTFSQTYYADDTNKCWIYANNGFDGSITNISVLEITDDTNLPRINYSGFTYQDSLGSELVTNGSFDTDSANWFLTGTSFWVNSSIEVPTGALSQVFTLANNKTYKITFDVIQGSGIDGGVYVNTNYNTSDFANNVGATTIGVGGTYTYTFTMNGQGNGITLTRRVNNQDIRIDNVSVKEYLGQEVVPDSGCGAWLFEPQSTNLIPYSEDFSNASWSKASVSVVSNNYISPDGTINADKIIDDTTNNIHRIQDTISTLNSGNHTYSIFLKKGTLTTAYFQVFNSGTASAANVDLENGTITSAGVGFNHKIEDYGNDWYRCSISFVSTNTATTVYLYLKQATAYVGTGEYLYAWGAQLEQQSYSTSYIPTEGTIKTRNQDLCTNGGDASLINSSEGVLYFEGSTLVNNGNRFISLRESATAQDRMFLRFDTNGTITFRYYVGGSISINIVDSTINALDKNKIACKWELNNFSLWLNGIKVGEDLSGNVVTPNTYDKLQFNEYTNINNFFGNTKALGVWKEALTDEELRSLTYPTPTAPTFDLDFNTIATDFIFTRNSEATFVNAQGLIQSTNEFGEEEITNGDFSTDGIPSTTSWSLGWYSQTSNVLISGGKLTLTNSASQSSALAYATDGVSSLNVVTVNKTYKLQYRVIENNGVTSFKYYSAGGSFIVAPTDLGVTHTIYIKNIANQIFLFQNATTNSSISIDNVSVKEYITETNTPRLDYSTGAEAFLLEPQRTNLLQYSNDYADSYWLKSASGSGVAPIVTSNYAISPDGTQNADRIQFDASNSGSNSDSSRFRTTLTLVDGLDYTTSFYAKSKGVTDQKIGIIFDNSQREVFTVTNEWQRFTKTITQTNTSSICGLDLRGAVASTSDILVYGFQIEQGSYATSYIPTDGTTVTRNQELSSKNNVNELFDGNVGSIYLAYDGISTNGTTLNNMTPFRLYGQPNNKIRPYYSPDADFLGTSVSFENGGKIAWSCNGTTILTYINGVLKDTHTITNNFTTLSNFALSTGFMTHRITDIKVYPKALTDVELQDLTTI